MKAFLWYQFSCYSFFKWLHLFRTNFYTKTNPLLFCVKNLTPFYMIGKSALNRLRKSMKVFPPSNKLIALHWSVKILFSSTCCHWVKVFENSPCNITIFNGLTLVSKAYLERGGALCFQLLTIFTKAPSSGLAMNKIPGVW